MHCQIMQPTLHRSTLWRRAKRRRSKTGQTAQAGRREKAVISLPWRKRIAALIDARRLSRGPIDYDDARWQGTAEQRRILQLLNRWLRSGLYAPGLVMVATADALRLGTRRRTNKPKPQRRNALGRFRRRDEKAPGVVAPSAKSCCPSQIFPVSRQMVSFWRRRKQEDFSPYLMLRGGIRGLVDRSRDWLSVPQTANGQATLILPPNGYHEAGMKFFNDVMKHILHASKPAAAAFQSALALGNPYCVEVSVDAKAAECGMKRDDLRKGAFDFCKTFGLPPSEYMAKPGVKRSTEAG